MRAIFDSNLDLVILGAPPEYQLKVGETEVDLPNNTVRPPGSVKGKLVNSVFVWEEARTIEQLRTITNEKINGWRLEANDKFTHDGKEFWADALSWKDISGVQMYVLEHGALPPGFPGVWKAVDNTYYPIPNLSAWSSFYSSAVQAGTSNFLQSEGLKTYMNSPSRTKEEIAAITWDLLS